MKLSVIIPAYNDVEGVLTALNSLRALNFGGYPVEYIVQDDASPERDLTNLIPPEIASTQRNANNLGFGGNCNAGAARATGDVLFFVNQDVYGVREWSDYWANMLMGAFDEAQVGIVGSRLLFPNASIQNAGGLIDALGQPFHRNLGWSNPHHPDVMTPCAVTWTTGAALAIRHTLWDRLGGFDPAFPMYWEDVDICLRAREMGVVTWYQPACTLFHRVGSTGGSPSFMASAKAFHERWVASGKLKPDVYAVKEHFWA